MSQTPSSPRKTPAGRSPAPPTQQMIINDLGDERYPASPPGIVNDLPGDDDSRADDSTPGRGTPAPPPGIVNDLPPDFFMDQEPPRPPAPAPRAEVPPAESRRGRHLAPRTEADRPGPVPNPVPPVESGDAALEELLARHGIQRKRQNPVGKDDGELPRPEPPGGTPLPPQPTAAQPRRTYEPPAEPTAASQPRTLTTVEDSPPPAPKAPPVRGATKPVAPAQETPRAANRLGPAPGTGPAAPVATGQGRGGNRLIAARVGATSTQVEETELGEREVWVGGYSGRAQAPTLVLCLGLTAGLVWGCYQVLPPDLFPLTAAMLTAAVWAMPLVRWSYRAYGYTYRLTTRHVYLDHGWLYPGPIKVELTEILKVAPRSGVVGFLLGVGQVRLQVRDTARPTVVLEGVRSPRRVARQFQELVDESQKEQRAAF